MLYMLTEDQKRVRVDWCRHMLKRFNAGESKDAWEVSPLIVSGDETSVYSLGPDTKQQWAQWMQWTPADATSPVQC